MNLYFRLLLVIIKSLFGAKLDVLGTSVLSFRVLPNDLDTNVHMNNGRYLTIMDLGRLNMIIRNGLAKEFVKYKYAPVLSAVQARYRIPLMPFQRYELHSRIVCWDKKWAYMEQRFIIVDGPKAGAVAAIGLLKGSFFDPKTKSVIPTDEIIARLPEAQQKNSPEFPDYVLKSIEAEEALRQMTAA
ncbi:MAG: thioesterase family protein [Pseudomonadota bacterium]